LRNLILRNLILRNLTLRSLTGVQDELHHVGGNIVADVLEASGWDVRFLGTNMPREAILRVIGQQRADVVGISVTMLFNIPQCSSISRN